MKTNYNTVSYNEYVCALNEIAIISNNGQLNEGMLDSLKGLTGRIGELISNAKKTMAEVLDDTKLETKDLIKAFKNKEVFNVLKRFGFSIKKMLSATKQGVKYLNAGLSKVFKEIHNNKIVQKIHSGVMTVDEFINKHPILNKVGGVVVAGILLWIWLNMSFTGVSLDYDIDQGALLDALAGKYSLADLFTSPDGLKTIAFLSLGLSGISVTGYLGSTAYNLTMSIIYTALQKSNFKDGTIMNIIKKKAHSLAEQNKLPKKLSFKEYISETKHVFFKFSYGNSKSITVDAENFEDAVQKFTKKTGMKPNTIKSMDLVEQKETV